MTLSTDLEAQGSLAPPSLESVRNAFIEWRKAKNPADKTIVLLLGAYA